MGAFPVGPLSPPEASIDAVRPRELVDRPEMFGQWGKPMKPADGIDIDDARYAAACVQHWVTNAIREEVAARRTNLASLLETLSANAPQLTYHRALRLQRGEEPMHLADLIAWARLLPSVRAILGASLGASLDEAAATRGGGNTRRRAEAPR